MTQDAPAAPRPLPSEPAATHTGRLNRYVPRALLEHLLVTPEQTVRSEDGTMVFVDISGFTKLSERLARSGREGAEHLVDTISACFSTLLAEAYANGGSLLKFGGDALLVWFAGADHATRGCSSAIAMRRTLRQIGRIRAGASSIVLRMSVGVHSGRYEMFLVGGSHREYLIGGPSVGALTALESAAQAGQILVSDQTAALLPDRCLGARSEPGVLLARAPATPLWILKDASATPSDEQVALCLSTALRAHLLATPAHPEHRTATVSFLQFGQLDALLEVEGTEAAASAVDEIVRAAQEAADRYEICILGSDIAADGGKLLFSAGAPRAIGDDEERMLLTMRHIIDADTRLPVRAGVTRGYVFTGEVGPPYRRTYAVMGDVVNLAARLAAKAPWREVYTIDPVLHRAQHRFASTAVPPFMVKGKSRPIEAFAVGAALRAAPTSGPAVRLPLCGRDAELATIADAIERAKAGSGALVELSGENGTGKSRLLAEARERAGGMRAIRTICESYTRGVPYIQSREMLRQLLGLRWDDSDDVVLAWLRAAVTGELEPWLPLLAIALGVEAPSTREVDELAADVRAAKLHEVVVRFLADAFAVPTLAQVEHTEHMDEASAALLQALVEHLPRSSWLIVATRHTPGESEHSIHIELGPLADEDAFTLAEATPYADVLPPHTIALAVERAAGNPEFLVELLASAAGRSGELPESIEAAASARIDALDPGDRALIRRAALRGSGCPRM
jgi:class 3 adenylate cyclase